MAKRFFEQRAQPVQESGEPTRALTRFEKSVVAVGTLLSMAGFVIVVTLTLALGGPIVLWKGLFALALANFPVFFIALIVKRLRVLLQGLFILLLSVFFGCGGAFGVVVLALGVFLGTADPLALVFILMPGLFLVLGSYLFTASVLGIIDSLGKVLSGSPAPAPREETMEERQLEALNDIQARRDQGREEGKAGGNVI